MARIPQRHNRPTIIQNWVQFFVGTPKRFLWTCLGVFVALAAIMPTQAALALGNVISVFVTAFGPSAGPLLSIAIAIGGIWIVAKAIFPKKKGKSGH